MQINNLFPIFEANQACWFALFYKTDYRVIINLLLFIGLMVGAYYLSKFLIAKSPYSAPHHTGKVMERLYIGHQSSMTVVDLQGVQYVFVNDKGKTTLVDRRTDLHFPEQVAPIQITSFQDVLKKIMNKNNQ